MPSLVSSVPLKSDRRRALELLASCKDGCPEGILRALGFEISDMVELVRAELVRAGLVSAQAERVVAGSRKMEVATLRITDAGRRALQEPSL
jgi:hypothetical protein